MTKELQHLGFVSNGVFFIQREGEYFAPPFYLRLHEGLMRMFPEVTFYCPVAAADDPVWARDCTQKFNLPHLRIASVPLSGNKLRRGLGQMLVYWRSLANADVICIDLPSELGFFASLVCRLRGKKYFVRVLGDWALAINLDHQGSLSGKIKAFIADWMARTVVTRAQLALFQGQELHRKYADQLQHIATSDKVHSTLTAELFYERQTSGFHTPARLLTVSRLVPLKGLDVLLQSLQLLTRHHIEVEWWCVGEGPARAALEQLAAELGLSERVKFLGNIPNGPELYRLYREADIFLLPSRTEGISQALLEALAHSLPAVASEVGGIPGVLTHQVNGLLVPPGDPQALAAAIHQLIAEPVLARQLQQAGFARAQNFRADVLRQSFREMIETTFGRISGAPQTNTSEASSEVLMHQ